MASSKNLLKQLLDEDQEPFVLKKYIDERRYQLKKSVQKTHLQIKKQQKPISETSSFFCKNPCFSSFLDSPNVKMSPLFSPVRNSPNTLFVHIPSRTAALLLESALRIQNYSSSKKPKNHQSNGFGFFGSMLKKITNRNKKRNINNNDKGTKVKDILRWDSYNGRSKFTEEMIKKEEKLEESTLGVDEFRVSEVGFSCSCNSRFSSAWSSSNEEKSMDLETSSSRSEDSEEEMNFVNEQIKTEDFSFYEKEFCSSPFRFVLQNCSSTGEITPEFRSPIPSPSRLKKQAVKNEDGKELEEEEKEQFSPVSVLDPQFEEDDEEGQEDDDEYEDNDGPQSRQLELSFANVQRARQQLLHKLRRFEQLAKLDPIELEKRISEDEEEEELYGEEEEEILSDGYKGDLFVREVLSESNLCNVDERIPSDMKRLVFDLMAEEEEEENDNDFGFGSLSSSHDCQEKKMMKKLRKRFDSWKEVELNTIDMMVELDFRSEGNKWQKDEQQMREIGTEIEFDIFNFLMKELSEELVHSSK